MSSTLTIEQTQAIQTWLDEHPTLAIGLGTTEQACSIAAINLALTGELTDDIPDCMSRVIGRWIIRTQDAALPHLAPEQVDAWKRLLPYAAGTGIGHEPARKEMIVRWMWDVLKLVQPLADARGVGEVWAKMVRLKTATAAYAAAAASAGNAAAAAAYAAAAAAYAAGDAADAAAYAAQCAAGNARKKFWRDADPVSLLRKLIAVTDDEVTP